MPRLDHLELDACRLQNVGTCAGWREPPVIRVCCERQRTLAMIVARILDPGSKLATARGLAEATARDSLAETLALGEIDEDDLYAAMDCPDSPRTDTRRRDRS